MLLELKQDTPFLVLPNVCRPSSRTIGIQRTKKSLSAPLDFFQGTCPIHANVPSHQGTATERSYQAAALKEGELPSVPLFPHVLLVALSISPCTKPTQLADQQKVSQQARPKSNCFLTGELQLTMQAWQGDERQDIHFWQDQALSQLCSQPSVELQGYIGFHQLTFVKSSKTTYRLSPNNLTCMYLQGHAVFWHSRYHATSNFRKAACNRDE